MEVIVNSLVDMYLAIVTFAGILIVVYALGFIISLKDWKDEQT